MINYEEDVRISPDDLDLDCVEQPELMLKYTKHAAKLKKEADDKKEELEYLYSKLDKEIKESPEEYDVAKISEAAVDKAIKRQDSYRKAVKIYNEALFEYNNAKGAVQAFQDRKNMLQELVTLHGQEYFAGPATPNNLSKRYKEKREKSQKETNKVVKNSLKGNKTKEE